MKRLMVALLIGGTLLGGTAGSTLALPPSPIRGVKVSDAARNEDFTGRLRGAYVSTCARTFPTDPTAPCEDIGLPPGD